MFREFCLSHNALLQKTTFYGIIHNEKKTIRGAFNVLQNDKKKMR